MKQSYLCYNSEMGWILSRDSVPPAIYRWYCLPSECIFMVPIFDYDIPLK